MASPFSLFRRYQGILLAVFGVALMVAFVVLPAVIQMQQAGGGGGYSADAVLTWTGGEVSQSDVRSRQQRRRMAFEFLDRLQGTAKSMPGGADMNAMREAGVLERLASNSASSAVETMLLAQKGRDMGMSVDEKAVNDFLANVTDNVFLTESELANAARGAVRGTSLASMYETLKEELLAYHVRQMALKGVAPTNRTEMTQWSGTVTTPSKAWEYFNRMNRRVTAEFVPFAAEDFVSKIDDPSASEVQAYYDKYKNDYPSVGSPEPGFKHARKVDFQYVVADFNQYMEEEKPKVTQAQLEEYYEANKKSFIIQEEESPVEEFDPDDPRGAIPSPPTAPVDEPNEDPIGEPAVEPTEEPAVDPTPDEEPDLPEEDTPVPEVDPSDETPDEDSPESDKPADSGCQDEAPDGEDTEPEVPDTDTPDTDTPDADPTLPDVVEPPADTTPPETTPDDLTVPEQEQKYKPLSEVEDQIRAAIARPLAEERLTAAMDKAAAALKNYYNHTIDFEAEIRGVKDPGEFDGEAVAKKLGLKYGTTGLISRRAMIEAVQQEAKEKEAAEKEAAEKGVPAKKIEEKMEIAQSSTGSGQTTDYFLNIGYREGLANYQPIETQIGGREKVYLAWKVNEVEAFVPELKDIKDEVVKAWKLNEARKLAEKAADDLAAEIKGDKPLKGQVGGDRKVITPPAFSYYDPISVLMMRFRGQPPTLASIEDDIEDQSSDTIKREVVQMPVGGVRVVPNAAETVYYVVRLAKDESNPAEARDEFMQSIVDNPGGEGAPIELLFVGRNDQLRLFSDWYQELEKHYEVRQIDPDFFQNDG